MGLRDEGRQRQSERMLRLCKAQAEGKVAVADFVAPFFQARLDFNADYEVFVDTIKEGRFEDTNKVFERSAVTMSGKMKVDIISQNGMT